MMIKEPAGVTLWDMKSYYEKATDKKTVIKEIVGSDYSDMKAVQRFSDESGYCKELDDEPEVFPML